MGPNQAQLWALRNRQRGGKAGTDQAMAIGYYMAVPMSVDKSGVLFRVYHGSA